MDDDESADAAARLESALERIAELAQRRSQVMATGGESDDTGSGGAAAVDASAIAGRLDTLIARLRDVLDS